METAGSQRRERRVVSRQRAGVGQRRAHAVQARRARRVGRHGVPDALTPAAAVLLRVVGLGGGREVEPGGEHHRALHLEAEVLQPASRGREASIFYFLTRTDATEVDLSQNGRQKGRSGRRRTWPLREWCVIQSSSCIACVPVESVS
jgi:hypothetical protein